MSRILQDEELVQYLADEPELLAIADAMVATIEAPMLSTSRAQTRRKPRARMVALLAAAALVVAGTAAAVAYRVFDSSPGLSGGFSAFTSLAATESWPPSLGPAGLALEHSASYMGVSEATFVQRLRLLQTGLPDGSGTNESLYAYLSIDDIGACLFVTDQGGTCLNAANAPSYPGVLPAVLPGNPGRTPAVVALVADNVKSIDLVVGDSSTALPIHNNSVYGLLHNVPATATLSLVATYADGGKHAFSLPNPAKT